MNDQRKSQAARGSFKQPHIRRLAESFSLTREDELALTELARSCELVPKGHRLKTYRKSDAAVLLLDGLAARTRESHDGERHIVGFLLPGEMSFIQFSARRQANYDLIVLAESVVAVTSRQRLRQLEEEHPRLQEFFAWGTQLEVDALQDRLLTICTGTVEHRILQLLENLYRRLEKIGLASDQRFSLSLRQYHIGQAVGATPVHVSKTLGRLAASGRVITTRGYDGMHFDLNPSTDRRRPGWRASKKRG